MYSANNLVSDLIDVLRIERELKDFKLSKNRSQDIIKNIRTNPTLQSDVHELVWHFLSDADIRSKDENYKLSQTESMTNFLKDWPNEPLHSTT